MNEAKMREEFNPFVEFGYQFGTKEAIAAVKGYKLAYTSRDAEVEALRLSCNIAATSWKAETTELIKTQYEVEVLKAQLAAANKLIEDSRNQEPSAKLLHKLIQHPKSPDYSPNHG